jgi:regulator of protease activity HflC (stomatin/prohibitin superfamily)
MLFLVIAAVILVVFALKAVVVVPNDKAYIVERMGVYVATLHPGFHVLMPLLDKIRYKHSTAVQTQELSEVVETRDRQQASVASTYRFRILDPQRASYGAADYASFLRELVRTSQKRYVAGQTWDALRQDSRSFEAEVQRAVDEAAESVGLKLVEYSVKDMQPQG